ncbi:glycosyltransferase [bacterium]|nr:glycosyltransferase [bacterium]
MIRIPILCDATGIEEERPVIRYGDGIFKICFAGSLDWEKEGFDILLKSLAQVNLKHPAELYLYGDMPDWVLRKIDQVTNEYALERKVVYIGNVDAESLMHEFRKYHLLILPRPLTRQSTYGFSTKLSEYLISGIPVLLTDVSDNALYIKDNYNGYLIAPGSVSVMTDKILEIMEGYDSNASVIAGHALQTAKEKLDYRLYSKTFIDFFFNN